MWPAYQSQWFGGPPVDGDSRHMRPLQLPISRLPAQVDLRRYMSPIEDQADMSTWYIKNSKNYLLYFSFILFHFVLVLLMHLLEHVNILLNVKQANILMFHDYLFTIMVK